MKHLAELMRLGHGPQRYVALAISADGCVKRFGVRGDSEASARRKLEKFLRRHWYGYQVAELLLETSDDRTPPPSAA